MKDGEIERLRTEEPKVPQPSVSPTLHLAIPPSSAAAPPAQWALTQDAFDLLLTGLDADREQAGEKYLELRRHLIRMFEWRGCPFPEDHADESLNRVARKLSEGETIRDPAQYAVGVARLLVLEIRKEQARRQYAMSELTDDQAVAGEPEIADQRLECLERCLAKLPPEDRELILRYYQGEKSAKIENRRRLTERFKVPLNALRMRALRLREKLQQCVERCIEKKW